MPENFSTSCAGIASGTNKALINIFNPVASPLTRGRIYDILIGSVATPADQSAHFAVHRTTAVGTEASGFTPINLDSGGPAGEYDSGIGAFTAQPTETANKQLLRFSLNQRATFRWVAAPGSELVLPGTQNNGADLKTVSSTSTQAHEATILFSA